MLTITLTGGPLDGQTAQIEDAPGIRYYTPGSTGSVYLRVGETEVFEWVEPGLARGASPVFTLPV